MECRVCVGLGETSTQLHCLMNFVLFYFVSVLNAIKTKMPSAQRTHDAYQCNCLSVISRMNLEYPSPLLCTRNLSDQTQNDKFNMVPEKQALGLKMVCLSYMVPEENL